MPSQCCASLRQGSLESCSGPGRSGVAPKLSSSVALLGSRLAASWLLLSAYFSSVAHLQPEPSGQPYAAGFRTPGEKCAGYYQDRKSTRLNSSHGYISYAVFCLKKQKTK